MTVTGGIQVIERAAEILRQLKLNNQGQSLGMLAASTGLPRSTVQRIVNALISEDFVSSSGKDGSLCLGPELQALASAGRIDVPNMIRPALEALSAKTGETVDLAVYTNGRMTIVDQIPGQYRLSAVSVPGEDFPLSSTANGRAVLSLLKSDVAADIFRNECVEGDLSAFLDMIRDVRTTGMAFDLDEHTVGISAAGIAFETVTGDIFAVSIPAPSQRFSQNRDSIVGELKTFQTETIMVNSYFSDEQ
ncbi:MAG: IclR family transcriptional regulator [Pseudomonadota bacterium]